MTTASPPPSAPSPAEPPGARRRTGAREVAGWVAGIAATLALAVLAAGLGTGLGVFGLSAVALVLLLGLLALAAWRWRRAALALSVVGLALASTTVLATLEPVRIAPSAGLLLEAPTRAADLNGRELRRGLGSVVVDLRHSAFRPGETVKLAARSDVGRVIVVLPIDRCVAVRLHARPLELDGPIAGSFAVTGADLLGISAVDDRYAGQTWTDLSPLVSDLVAASRPGDYGPVGAGVRLFGRDLVRPWEGVDSQMRPVTVSRPTTDASAPTVDLTLAAPGQVTVTALPDGVGPLADLANQYEQVSDASWPAAVALPPRPEELDWQGRWREDWSKSPDELLSWRRWERRVVVAAHEQARRLAGPCATRYQLRDTWVSSRYALRPGNGDGHKRVISVNALGEVFVGGLPGTRPASRTAADIVRGTKLRLLDATTARERDQTQIFFHLAPNA